MADERGSDGRPTLSQCKRRPELLVQYLRREVLMVSQEAFARAMNVSTWSIGRWERGERRPNFFHLRQLVEMYETSEVSRIAREGR